MFRTGLLLTEIRLGGPSVLLPDVMFAAPEGIMVASFQWLYFGVRFTLMPVGAEMTVDFLNHDGDEDCACGHH